ncbi:MAG: hypothetical protein V7K89_20275 [Nostoc sp.]|uniref:hypothetical protein n=1 Tax=Nostoc sp. TaxID=1180 RepID=UPI002FFAC3E9
MELITIRPGSYRQFGPSEDCIFYLVTNTDIVEQFLIEKSGAYTDYRTVTYDQEGSFEAILQNQIPENSHIFVVSPNCFFRSPNPEVLGDKRKLIAMASNSTPTPLEAVKHFLGVIERTDPYAQAEFADRFFELGQKSDRLEIVDEEYGTRAIFDHLNDKYEWNLQAGPLEWGEQQIAPSGEISVLPADIWEFNPNLYLAINGEIAFRGLPILHSGEPSFLREDQARIFSQLRHMKQHALIAKVEQGVVTDLHPTHPDVEPAAEMLKAMGAVDSRYLTIWELGFAINTSLDLLWGNYAMNEVYGGTSGALHFGLGLTPYTQYHLDLICPGIRVYGKDKKLLLGTPELTSAVTR